MKSAFFDTPRHHFVKRFRRVGETVEVPVRDSDNIEDLELIYKNQPLMYVDDGGLIYEASNSEPAFIFHLLCLMNIRKGDRVLEIGCGTGWLLAILSRLVGSSGEVVGVEILRHLADEARSNLEKAGVQNYQIIAGDGANVLKGSTSAKFDKVIVTASVGDVSTSFYDAVNENGILVLPLRNRGLAEEVLVLEKKNDHFRSRHLRVCKFVRMTGADRLRAGTGLVPVDQSPFWSHYTKAPIRETAYSLSPEAGNDMMALLPLSSFLSKTENRFRAYQIGPFPKIAGLSTATFGDWETIALGIEDRKSASACIWHKRILKEYCSGTAARTFERSVQEWLSFGSPSGADFDVKIFPAGAVDPEMLAPGSWREDRGDSTFFWTLKNPKASGGQL
jgi:protein-L-isoaspartate(D-aspartate) O-methyltransferase